MRYLLDTNIVSNLVRNPQGRVADRLNAVGEQNICTSIIVAAEWRYGTTKKASPRLTAQVECQRQLKSDPLGCGQNLGLV